MRFLMELKSQMKKSKNVTTISWILQVAENFHLKAVILTE